MSYLYGRTLDALMVPKSDYSKMLKDVKFLSGMHVALAGGEFISAFGMNYFINKNTQNLIYRVRAELVSKYLSMDMQYFDDPKNTVSAMVDTITNDGQKMEGVLGIIIGQMLNSFTSLTSGVIMSLALDWKLGLVSCACVPFLVGSGSVNNAQQNREQQHNNETNKSIEYARESMDALDTVLCCSSEAYVIERYDRLNRDNTKDSQAVMLVKAFIYGVSQGMAPFATALLFWYGAKLIREGQTTPQDFFTVIQVIVFGSQQSGQAFASIPKVKNGYSSAKRIKEAVDQQPVIDNTEGTVVTKISGDVEFEDVHFRYLTSPSTRQLRGLSFHAAAGETIALVGTSEREIHCTIPLLEQFYRPLAGTIRVDSMNISMLSITNYRRHIGLVPQTPVLYPGTIRENILMGLGPNTSEDSGKSVTIDDTSTETLLCQAARRANIHNFIMSLPDGYETQCGSGGEMLSAGQMQRIAIARAIIGEPEILLLDDVTSGLDGRNERLVQRAVAGARKGRTTVVVTNRLATVGDADRIYVIMGGRVVEFGTHEQLVELDGRYASMVRDQGLL